MESKEKIQPDKGLSIENLQDLLDSVRIAGFGERLNEAIRLEVRGGKDRFSVSHSLLIGEDKVEYRLDFRMDKAKGKCYFNDMLVILTEKNGIQRSQFFPRFLRITAKEAYNLLKWGLDTGVEKSLYNKGGGRYRSCVTIDVHAGKDLYGNYPIFQYHENYYKEPFTIAGALRRLPVRIKDVEVSVDFERLVASLKRGNMTAVTVMASGREVRRFLSVNAKAGRLDLRGPDFKLIELSR